MANPSQSFQMNGDTLELIPSAALDFETNPVLDVSVVVNDGTNNSNQIDVSLTVLNVNDNVPTLAYTPAITEISEDADTTTAAPAKRFQRWVRWRC